jgi:hypothetical protein
VTLNFFKDVARINIKKMQKKNYENSNIFHHAKIYLIFTPKKKKSSPRNQNPSRYHFNSITNFKVSTHKPKYYHLPKILI